MVILTIITLMFNPVSAFAGTTTKDVSPPKGNTTSAKAVVDVQPSAKAVVDVAPKAIPVPTKAEIASAPKAERSVGEAEFQAAIVTLTKLAQQGAKRDDEQDARLTALENRADETDCKIVRLENFASTAEVRLQKIEANIVTLQKGYSEIKLATGSVVATATASSAAVSTTPAPTAQQPTIIVVPMPVMNGLPAASATSTTTSTVPSCTTTRTSAPQPVLRLAPSPPRQTTRVAPPVTASAGIVGGGYDPCRPGLITRAWNALFGGGCAPVVRQIPVPVMDRGCPPPRMANYCSTPSCFLGRQQFMPGGFGWQQPCIQQHPVAFRSRCGPGFQQWGGSGRPSVVVTNSNNNNNNNNLLALMGRH